MKSRNSSKRKLILDLFEKSHVLTAKEIIEAVEGKMDKATVYRNLLKLVKNGILKELKIDKGYLSYELVTESHQHFKCRKCNTIIAIHIEDKKLKNLVVSDEFLPEEFELNILGICKDCNESLLTNATKLH